MRRNEWLFLPGGCGPAINRGPTTSLIWYEGGRSGAHVGGEKTRGQGQAGEGWPLIDSIARGTKWGMPSPRQDLQEAARSRCPARDAVVGRACRATASRAESLPGSLATQGVPLP
jgi:hypothetical protein